MPDTTIASVPAGHSDLVNHVVLGRVTASRRTWVGGLGVRLYERSVGPDLLVGQTTTDDTGLYRTDMAGEAHVISSILFQQGKPPSINPLVHQI